MCQVKADAQQLLLASFRYKQKGDAFRIPPLHAMHPHPSKTVVGPDDDDDDTRTSLSSSVIVFHGEYQG